mgnify:CR=1 FL=1
MQNQGYRPAPQKAPAEPPHPHKRRERLIQKKRIFLVCSLTAVVIIVAAAVAAMTRGGNEERRAYNASRQTFLDGIYVDGISLGGLTYNEAWDAVSKRVQEWENAWSLQIACNGFVYSTVNYAAAGIHVDYEQIDSLLQSAWAIGHTGGYEQYLSDAQRLAQESYQGYIEPAEGWSLQKMYIVPRRMRRLQPLILLMPKNLSPLPILFMGARLIRRLRKQKFCAAPQREKAAGMIFPWSALNRKLPWRMQNRTCRFWPWPLRP